MNVNVIRVDVVSPSSSGQTCRMMRDETKPSLPFHHLCLLDRDQQRTET